MSHHLASRRRARRHALRTWTLERMEERTLLSVLTVNTTDDADNRDAVLSLREAIELNNGTLAVGALTAGEQAQLTGDAADRNAIHFDIPGSGVRVITLVAELPTVSHPAEIDGTTQTGFDDMTRAPIVELDGNGIATGGLLVFNAPDSALEGLVINHLDPNASAAIHVASANFVLRGNY